MNQDTFKMHYQETAPPSPELTAAMAVKNPPVADVVPKDSIVESIVAKFQQRSAVGWKKYGTTLDRNDLGILDWIQHAQEELMDGILYLEKLKKELGESPASATVGVAAATASLTQATTNCAAADAAEATTKIST